MDRYLYKALDLVTREPVEGFLQVVEYKEDDRDYEDDYRVEYMVKVGGIDVVPGSPKPFVCKIVDENGYWVRLYEDDEICVDLNGYRSYLNLSKRNILNGDFRGVILGDRIESFTLIGKPL